MPITPVERYRRHAVWEMLDLRNEALNAARYSTAETESLREDILEIIRLALLSKSNPIPVLYETVLNGIQTYLNSLTADEGGFQAFVNNGYSIELANHVRQLPGPPPRQVNDRYVAALDSAISAREIELSALISSMGDVQKQIATLKRELVTLSDTVERQESKITADSATISQVVSAADGRLSAEWTNKVSAWELERKTKDQVLDTQLSDNIRLLAGAAAVGSAWLSRRRVRSQRPTGLRGRSENASMPYG